MASPSSAVAGEARGPRERVQILEVGDPPIEEVVEQEEDEKSRSRHPRDIETKTKK